jgi:alpha-D-xyloside xylohydrolase
MRWLQFGAFCPMMRSHGEGAPREIYQFGKKGERVYDAIEKYINLRYRLLPYVYSTSWDVTANQSSMMRALMMDFANDKDALDINDQYMFGKSFLVCPVTKALYTSKTEKRTSALLSRTVFICPKEPIGLTFGQARNMQADNLFRKMFRSIFTTVCSCRLHCAYWA